MQITGTNQEGLDNGLGVNANNQVLADAVARHELEFESIESNNVFLLNIVAVTPTGAGDYFFYMGNPKNSGKKIYVYNMTFRDAAVETLTLERAKVGVPDTPTDIAPFVLSGQVVNPDIVVQQGADLDSAGGLDTTTNELVKPMIISTVDTDFNFSTIPPIVILPGYALQILASVGTTQIDGHLIVMYK